MKDYYQILGVLESASDQEIKAAYKKLAKQYHPDKNPGNKSAEEKFKGMSEAYNTLSDHKKRREYDMMRRAGARRGGFESGAGFSQEFDLNEFMKNMNFAGRGQGGNAFSDIFEGFFDRGNFGHQSAPEQSVELTIPFEKAIHGGEVEFVVHGKRLRITIPKGIPDGEPLRISNTEKGTILLTIRIQPDQYFVRKGDDLHVILNLNYAQLALGTAARIQTVYGGKVDVKIAGGTQPGTILKLNGLGVRSSRGVGDMYVTINVDVAKHLTRRQKELLEEFARSADMKW